MLAKARADDYHIEGAMITHDDASGPNVLTQVEAADRAAVIHGVEYDLALSLRAGRPDYEGDVTIRFEHRDPAAGVFLDCTGEEIVRLDVNDADALESEGVRWSRNRLQLPGALLRAGNIVRVVYRNAYDHSGVGLHQFRDPEDGAEYLYTQFEPYEAHRMLPCFDQPDIKARYRLRVAAPADWSVVSNAPETGAAPAPGADGEPPRRLHEFAQTQLFSPYLLALIAGPYHVFTDRHVSDGNGETPLGIYCRKSLAAHMDPEEFFEVTKQGLTFFADFFDWPYPFEKYDQLFVPEFNFGAMENVGAITFSERMVFRDPPTDLQRLNRAEVVLHEMAHMWFGDLVTMRWWNDLWLNESFATYMSYLAMQEATRFRGGAWPAFHARMKAWAYEQDQLVTTHPISGAVPDTDATFLNFDGITYGKGASVLKQLVAAIGREGFRDGMRHYFRTHAWGNTTLAQFLAALSHGAGRDLEEWSQLWLEQAGLNTLTAEWEAPDGRVSAFTVAQGAPPDHPTLRPHRVEIALFDAGADGAPSLRTAVPADIAGERTVIEELVGTAAPAAAFPNHDDHGYAKIALDPASLEFVRERLERFDDPLLRLQLWQSLWEMVRDQQFRSTEWLAMVHAKLPHEPALELVATTLAHAQHVIGAYVPESRRLTEARALFDLAAEQLPRVASQDLRITWARNLVGAAAEPESLTAAWRLVDEGSGIEGFELDQDMRWSLAIRAAAQAAPDADARLAGERARDGSDRGQRALETAAVARPDADVKAVAWTRFREDRDSSLHIVRSAMGGFWANRDWWLENPALLSEYVTRFFAEIRGIFEGRDKDFATSFFRQLYPSQIPTEDTISRTRAVLDSLTEGEVLLRRSLREALDEAQRAQACRAFAASLAVE